MFINPIYVLFPPKKEIGIIGAGQFAFATISYFILTSRYGRIKAVYDIDKMNAESLGRAYKAKVYTNFSKLIKDVDIVYIASNHASHSSYSIEALNNNKVVYCEKPVSVDFKQLKNLHNVVKTKESKFYCGYNRPHSPIIKLVKEQYGEVLRSNPLTLSCYVRGHDIPAEHWYRNPGEGTRVCGNLGHWIDLFVSLIWERIEQISLFKLVIVSSDDCIPDDNATLLITTNIGDLFSVTISSRYEPFEGIDESINLQVDKLNLKIDDFRAAKINCDSNLRKFKFRHKNVGHKNAINQPFEQIQIRNYKEYFFSSYLTIAFAEMIKSSETKIEIQSNQIVEFFK
ncbi:Gfo/Idh/MocA family protein [Catenovulum maritimum]|uniref:Gfo/Idh/MocA family protein n=1 Tax=Catenovulum maritimum TaxID=1513271 RepID=UPI00155ACFF7|nr:Gfo/Idh/MocA family oxidoreductase [Catenovulum maritimum]